MNFSRPGEDFPEREPHRMKAIIRHLEQIHRKLDHMANTQIELDAKLDELGKAVSDAAARVSADLAALLAKVNAGGDFSPEVAKVQAGIDALKAIDPAAVVPVATP